jgi:hypothetical protein
MSVCEEHNEKLVDRRGDDLFSIEGEAATPVETPIIMIPLN